MFLLVGARLVLGLNRKQRAQPHLTNWSVAMLKVSKFDKFTCQVLRNELRAVLTKHLGENANLEFIIGNMKFLDESAEIKLTAKVKGGKTAEEKSAEKMAKLLGLTTEPRNGKQLVKYNPRSYKYPFVYKNLLDGKNYKCDEHRAKLYFTA